MAVLPDQQAKDDTSQSALSDDPVARGNPFQMPPDSDVFLLRDRERRRKKKV